MDLVFDVATSVVNTDLIKAMPDVPVRWSVPNPAPAAFVVVFRSGSGGGPDWLDPAAMDFHCYAGQVGDSPKAAHEIAARLKSALLTMPGRAPRVADVDVTGEAFLSDPVSGRPRVIVGATVTLRPRDAYTPPPVEVPASVTSTVLAPMVAGAGFSQRLTASGTPPIVWSISAGALPAGLSLSAAGILSGTPNAAGAYSFTVRASNTAGSSTRAFTGTVSAPPPVGATLTVTTVGAAFGPRVVLHDGTATVQWLDDNDTVLGTGLAPSINFGTAAARTVRMVASDAADVHTINFGFNHADDAGDYNLGPAFNHPAQPVTAVAGLTGFPRLVNFCAASTRAALGSRLGGVLDLTGLADLEHVECFQALVNGVTLDGCGSLIRLCLEQCAINGRTIDLNPVRATIRDVRLAEAGGVVFAPLTGPLADVYHFCVRDQEVTNHPATDDLPNVEELLNWNTMQAGEFRIPSAAARQVMAYSNGYTTAVQSGPGSSSAWSDLDLSGNALTAVTLRADKPWGRIVNFAGNDLTQAAVDHIITTVAGWGGQGGQLALSGGTNAAPSPASDTALAVLAGRGWTVTVNAPVEPPGGGLPAAGIVLHVHADTLELADGTPVGAWTPIVGPTPVAAAAMRPTFHTAGGPNGGPHLAFDGTNGLEVDAGLLDATPEFTIGVTFRDRRTSGTSNMFSKPTGGVQGAPQLRRDSGGGVTAFLKSSVGELPLQPGVTADTWHVAVVRVATDGTTDTVTIGLDGTLRASKAAGWPVAPWGDGMMIGASAYETAQYLIGDLAHVVRYNRALDDLELVDLMDWMGGL